MLGHARLVVGALLGDPAGAVVPHELGREADPLDANAQAPAPFAGHEHVIAEPHQGLVPRVAPLHGAFHRLLEDEMVARPQVVSGWLGRESRGQGERAERRPSTCRYLTNSGPRPGVQDTVRVLTRTGRGTRRWEIRREAAVLSCLVLAGCLLAGCARGPAARQFPGAPVVIVSIDTLRADHLPAYGYAAGETPHLDRFRKEAILFENAYTPAPLTLPAHVSLFTGTLPFVHGVRDNLGYRLNAKAHPTLAGLLKAKGYATGAAVSAYVLRAGTGLGDDFDLYDDHIAAPSGVDALGRVQRSGNETLALVKPWLAGVKDRPFFLFFHVYEPHAPYDPPEPFKSRHALPYDGEVAASDAVVGGLLDELRRLGVYDRSIVIVLSDHGEGLGEHGEDEHGILLYRWALHVPLLLKLPGAEKAGTTVREPTGLVDVLPTVAELVGLPAPKDLAGRSVFAKGGERRLYAETYYPRLHLGWSELRALVDDRWQYVEGQKRELYDLGADPRQLTDVLAGNGELGRSRQKELAGLPRAARAARRGQRGGTREARGPRLPGRGRRDQRPPARPAGEPARARAGQGRLPPGRRRQERGGRRRLPQGPRRVPELLRRPLRAGPDPDPAAPLRRSLRRVPRGDPQLAGPGPGHRLAPGPRLPEPRPSRRGRGQRAYRPAQQRGGCARAARPGGPRAATISRPPSARPPP